MWGKSVLPVATSGIAVLLFEGGRTVHSRFRILPPVDQTSITSINLSDRNSLYRQIRDCDLIVWDEVIMAHRHLIEAVDRSLKKICRNNLPFGGKTIIFSGDAKQILPVVKPSRRGATVCATIFHSTLWKHVTNKIFNNFLILRFVKDFVS